MTTPIVSVEWLHDHLGDPDLRVIEATTVLDHSEVRVRNRGYESYEREHIPGAVYADLVDDFNDSNKVLAMVPTPEKFEAAAGRAGIGEGTRVVVYDAAEDDSHEPGASVWASRLWWQLRYEGFDDVSVLDGGLLAWVRAGYETSSGDEKNAPAEFHSHRRANLVFNKPDVVRATTDATTLIVDSRLSSVWAGDLDRGYGRGHIPSAISMYHGERVNPETALLRSPEELRTDFEAAGVLNPDIQPVFYCGGGVSCTWNLLALAVAGRTDGAIYDGSMLEWSADPDLPLETADSASPDA
ncbi:MAG: thiosulfate sulfurtransferase [Acidimicrobiaceae bacterium]|jgi:thiosulfate/3-mercaptopyruvate sulfurtransferase|nr:thiosulfate sulfurtransferase [Acidimicrobiaceae bacterium]